MLIELMKVTGRKFAFAYTALFAIWSACLLKGITDAVFQFCFGALVGAVMAANWGEHKAKGGKDAVPQEPPAK